MKSHISKAKLAALAVGLAIVMSSCGIQNQAGDSSGAPAAGKTKNYALAPTGTCWDDLDAFLAAHDAEHAVHNAAWSAYVAAGGTSWEEFNSQQPWQSFFQNTSDLNGSEWDAFLASVNDGVPCPSSPLDEEGAEVVGHSSVRHCVKPEVKQQLIDGYTEQLARPKGGEVTDEYIAKMQKGLDASNALCTN